MPATVASQLAPVGTGDPTPVSSESWSLREKLALASAVVHCGEQNWSSVSKLVRPFGPPGRPEGWCTSKSCARQYSLLLDSSELNRRRSEASSFDISFGELIVKKLTVERIEELQENIRWKQESYRFLKSKAADIQSGGMNDQLDQILVEIEDSGIERPERLIEVLRRHTRDAPPADSPRRIIDPGQVPMGGGAPDSRNQDDLRPRRGRPRGRGNRGHGFVRNSKLPLPAISQRHRPDYRHQCRSVTRSRSSSSATSAATMAMTGDVDCLPAWWLAEEERKQQQEPAQAADAGDGQVSFYSGSTSTGSRVTRQNSIGSTLLNAVELPIRRRRSAAVSLTTTPTGMTKGQAGVTDVASCSSTDHGVKVDSVASADCNLSQSRPFHSI